MTEDAASVVARLRAAGCVFAEDEAALLLDAAADAGDLERMLARRVSGVPLEHVLGWAEFCGRRIAVDEGVFVPRRRTELLVELAAAAAPPDAVVLDLCCGSGALGVAFAHLVGGASGRVELHAADVDADAVACAARNLAPLGGRVHHGDLFDPLPPSLRGRIDVLLANAPYVPTSAIPLLPSEARDFEPLVTLDGGADGLDVLRRVAAGAPEWLAPGGRVLVESSEAQAQASAAVAEFQAAGLGAEAIASEEHETTVVVATRPGQRHRRDPSRTATTGRPRGASPPIMI